MADDPEDSERTRVAAWESVCGAVMLIGGILLTHLAGVADILGLGLMFLGVGGLGHAVLYGLGLANLPETEDQRRKRRKDDDAHQ